MMPVARGTTFPMIPIRARVSNPSAMALLYLPRYGSSPLKFFHEEAFGAFFFCSVDCVAIAAVLNKKGMTSKKIRPMPGPLVLTIPSSPKGPPVV